MAAKAPGAPQHLLICARVDHYDHEGRLFSYAPYVRELDVWAQLFERVTVAGTLLAAPPTGDCAPFSASNIRVVGLRSDGGQGVFPKIRQVAYLPSVLRRLALLMRDADAIQARCPCDLGLLAVLMAPIFSKYMVAKYAGQWEDSRPLPLSWRIQKRLLRSRWWKGPVTIYDSGSDLPSPLVQVFNCVMSEAQVQDARRVAEKRDFGGELRMLFVGRLSRAKNVDVLLRALAAFRADGGRADLSIVGQGPEQERLEDLSRLMSIQEHVTFRGGLPFAAVLEEYKRADVLVLVSETEGWPKVVVEGMAFGLVCVASSQGILPWIMAEGRGLLVSPGDVEQLVFTLHSIDNDRASARLISRRASEWAARYTLERLREEFRRILSGAWCVTIREHQEVQDDEVVRRQ